MDQQRIHHHLLAAFIASLTLYLHAAHSGAATAPLFVPPSHLFTDTQGFMDATNAKDLTGALPQQASPTEQLRVGAVTFQSAPPSLLAIDALVPDSSDPFQLVVIGEDQLHIIPDDPKFSLGIELEEPSRFNPNADGDLAASTFLAVLCQVRFPPESECPESAVIDYARFETRFRDINGGPSPFFGLWSDQPIAQLTLRQLSVNDASEFFARVFGGDTPRPTPAVDRFESDDRPELASFLADELRGASTFTQTHSFHAADREDWIFYEGNVALFELRVLGAQPQFHGIVEMYPGDRLVDPSAQPLQVFGSCDAPAQSLVFNGNYPPGAQLFRVINCQSQAPVRYEFELEVIEFDTGVVLGLGQGEVMNEATGNPASVAMVSTAGQFIFSSPRNGQFRFGTLQGEILTLNVISPELEADPVMVPAVGPFEAPAPVTILVRERQGLLADGFE